MKPLKKMMFWQYSITVPKCCWDVARFTRPFLENAWDLFVFFSPPPQKKVAMICEGHADCGLIFFPLWNSITQVVRFVALFGVIFFRSSTLQNRISLNIS